jgi:ubiquinone/menaquinone biosynthesis C-methylase UbiE
MNVDASPVLRLQRLPLVGGLLRRITEPKFSPRVHHADVVHGLALADGSADLVYTSHVLEHLARREFDVALAEIHRVLAPGGVFRSVLPDLEFEARQYLASTASDRASEFMRATLLGVERRERGLMPALRAWLGNSSHKWMWDFVSISDRLAAAGFTQIRRASTGDSAEPAFAEVENAERWENCLGFECRKAG